MPRLVNRSRFVIALAVAVTVAAAPIAAQATGPSGPIYVALYWKARAGMEAEYEKYIRAVAQPIDDEAERDGAFEELRTYVPSEPNGEWTHLRIFRLKDQAQLDAFSAKMDAAGRRVYPDSTKRPASTHLRDLVRREVWRGFH